MRNGYYFLLLLYLGGEVSGRNSLILERFGVYCIDVTPDGAYCHCYLKY